MRPDERDDLLLTLKAKVELIERNYVGRQEIIPLKAFVYGVVSVSLMAVLGGIARLVLS